MSNENAENTQILQSSRKNQKKQQKLISKQSISNNIGKNLLDQNDAIYQPFEQIEDCWNEQVFETDSFKSSYTSENNKDKTHDKSQIKQEDEIIKTFCTYKNMRCIKYKSEYIYYYTSTHQLTDEEIEKLLIKEKKKENQKQPEKQNSQTKNLPSFFFRQFFKVINLHKDELSEEDRKLFIKYETSGVLNNANIAKLREFISVPTFNKLILDYLLSFDYLNDVLNSEKIADVSVHIQFLPRILLAVKNPIEFSSWK